MISIQERLGLHTEPIEGAAWQWSCMLRSSIPGKVVSFDPVKQTCVVQPIIQELMLTPPPSTSQNPSPGSSQNIPTAVTIAPIQDVLIMMMRVPGWSITLPIVVGTECLLVFSDTCIDGWWLTGAISPPYDRRRHDLSDAIALFGPWSQPNVLPNYSTASMQIRSDDQLTVIDLSSTGILITAPSVIAKQSGGTPAPVMTQSFLTWYQSNIKPFLVSKGYAGPDPPATSVTSVFGAQ